MLVFKRIDKLVGSDPGHYFDRNAVADGRVAGREQKLFRPRKPELARPCQLAVRLTAAQGKHIARRAVLRFVSIEGGEQVLRGYLQTSAESLQKSQRVSRGVVCGSIFLGNPAQIFPDGHAVFAGDAMKGPARQSLARIPFALTEVEHATGRDLFAKIADERQSAGTLECAERFKMPLRAFYVIDADKGRFAAHGQSDIVRIKVAVDGACKLAYAVPFLVTIRLGELLLTVKTAHRHLKVELHRRGLDGTVDGRGLLRVGSTDQRQMPLGCQEARGGVHADPARAGQKNLSPCVEGRRILKNGGCACVR